LVTRDRGAVKQAFRLRAAHSGTSEVGEQEVWLSGGAHNGERWIAALPPAELHIVDEPGDGSAAQLVRYGYVSTFAADGLPVMALIDRTEGNRQAPQQLDGSARSRRAREPAPVPSVIDRVWAVPVAAKVPEIIALFWVVKVLTTAGGEATSDYLVRYGNFVGGGIEVLVFVIGLFLQFGTMRYRALAYWWLAFSIAIFGTGVADFLHLDVHIPYSGTTAMWALILVVVLTLWHYQERTLSIHSIHTKRREFYYWATVFATFALGTALGDYTATALHLGYLKSGIVFGVAIVLPGLARWLFRLNSVVAFWISYVLTRPLGASFADYVSKPHKIGGIGFGNGPTAAVCFAAVAALVLYLAIARPDIQQGLDSAEV
jgi:uncharacterized membrane-anchored protein